jgi:hypothetical protein
MTLSQREIDELVASRRHNRLIVLALLGLLVVTAIYAWAVDFVTLTGERTIYTANCRSGAWEGNRCTGSLEAGARYRFRALSAHAEVLFWTAGSPDPAGKFTQCKVESGRNWSCPANAEAGRTVTLQMLHGEPVADPLHRTLELHSVHKVHWLLLRAGVRLSSTANE